jgi:hypothetical protein
LGSAVFQESQTKAGSRFDFLLNVPSGAEVIIGSGVGVDDGIFLEEDAVQYGVGNVAADVTDAVYVVMSLGGDDLVFAEGATGAGHDAAAVLLTGGIRYGDVGVVSEGGENLRLGVVATGAGGDGKTVLLAGGGGGDRL